MQYLDIAGVKKVKDYIDEKDVWEAGTGEGSAKLKNTVSSATGNFSVAEGESIASGYCSHAEGSGDNFVERLQIRELTASEKEQCVSVYGKEYKYFSSGDVSLIDGVDSYNIYSDADCKNLFYVIDSNDITITNREIHSNEDNYLLGFLLNLPDNVFATDGTYYYLLCVGGLSTASGQYSHAEGYATKASGYSSHAEGSYTNAKGEDSHAEGYNTTAEWRAHAEGYQSIASGTASHAEGNGTKASESSSHAEGSDTKASGNASHAEGQESVASGLNSHAEGRTTTASGWGAHSEGGATNASARYSHAEGYHTMAQNNWEHAQGIYNYSHKDDQETAIGTIHSIGIGTDVNTRKNAEEVMNNGDMYLIGVGNYTGSNIESSNTLQVHVDTTELSSSEFDWIMRDVPDPDFTYLFFDDYPDLQAYIEETESKDEDDYFAKVIDSIDSGNCPANCAKYIGDVFEYNNITYWLFEFWDYHNNRSKVGEGISYMLVSTDKTKSSLYNSSIEANSSNRVCPFFAILKSDNSIQYSANNTPMDDYFALVAVR